jgi:hypothetical protein
MGRKLISQGSRRSLASLRKRASDTSASMNDVVALNQRLTLLETMDKLACHLPRSVLNQLVSQVVHQENEQQVLNMLGKSIPINNKPLQTTTSAAEDPKRGPPKTNPGTTRTTRESQVASKTKKRETCLIGMTMTLDDSNSSRASDTSSIAEDHSWAHLLEDTSDEDSSLDDESVHSPSSQDTLEAGMPLRRHSAKSLPELLLEDEHDYPNQNSHQEVARMRHGRLSSTHSCNNMHNSMATLKQTLTTPQASSLAHIQATTRRLGSTRHTAALLFVDISGFVTMARSLDVESLSKVCWFLSKTP